MLTWEQTEEELKSINKEFIRLHEIGEKNWTPENRQEVYTLRKRCVELGEYRYKIAVI
jgi:hypothetical protein